jgi:hypothetical protein
MLAACGLVLTLPESLLVGFHMVWKQFIVGRICDAEEMNLDSCFAQFRAEVNGFSASTALDPL